MRANLVLLEVSDPEEVVLGVVRQQQVREDIDMSAHPRRILRRRHHEVTPVARANTREEHPVRVLAIRMDEYVLG